MEGILVTVGLEKFYRTPVLSLKAVNGAMDRSSGVEMNFIISILVRTNPIV